MKQSLYKLKTKEAEVAKMGFISTAVETTDIPKVESFVSEAY